MTNHFTLDDSPLWSHAKGPRKTSELAQRVSAATAAFKKLTDSEKVGFFNFPAQVDSTFLGEIQTLAAALRKQYQGALLFGIGGSHLGAAAMLAALRPAADAEAFPLQWLSNIDRGSVENAERFVQRQKTCAVLISKSGSTTETLAGFAYLSKYFPPESIVVITDPHSGDLRRLSKQYGLRALAVPPNIGGRFSVLTSVGLLPAALGGLNLQALLSGANHAREQYLRESSLQNPVCSLAAALHLWDTAFAAPTQYLMPYQSSLGLFSDWFVQLWGESLGKKLSANPEESTGPTPVGALGTTDQHSLLQLFHQGPKNKVVGFLDAEWGQAPLTVGKCAYDLGDHAYLEKHSFENISRQASLATQASLHSVGVPTYRIEVPQLNEASLGALFFFFETACAIAGELYGVNTYDQPGVEEAKRLLRRAL